MATAIEILNTVRDNISEEYRNYIPQATQNNFQEIGNIFSDLPENLRNEFISALVNKVGMSKFKSRQYKNPLARLKGSQMPYGSTVEEIFVNPTIGEEFDGNNQMKLLTQHKPDGKTAYFAVNRKNDYPITINESDLRMAFRNPDSFMQFFNNLFVAMYSGDASDEYTLTTRLMGQAIDNSAIMPVDVDLAKPLEFAKSISNIAKSFTFMSDAYSSYNYVNADKILAGEKKVRTFCEKERQILFLRADAQTEIDFEVLASLYHIPQEMLERNTIIVDDFRNTNDENVFGVLCDEGCIQVRDYLMKVTSQQIGSALATDYWLHHWQIMYFSLFGNAVYFIEKKTI